MVDPVTLATLAGAGLNAGTDIFFGNKAADAQDKAARQAARLSGVATQQQLALSQPFLNSGLNALNKLNSLFGLPDAGGFGSPGVQPGLTELPGVFWAGRQVFQDESGSLFSTRGRDATLGSAGLELLGTPTRREKGGAGVAGKLLTDQNGKAILYGEDGELTTIRGEAITPKATSAQGQTHSDVAPTSTADLLDSLRQTPGFQFRQEEGERAISRNAAARGVNQSGGTLRDLTAFNQNLAQTTVNQNLIDPLFALAGFGPIATSQANSAIANGAVNQGNAALNQGHARSSAFANRGQAVGGFLGSLGTIAGRGGFDDLFKRGK